VIDPAAAVAKVTGVIGTGDGASLKATQAMINALADCWDDCEVWLGREPATPNPYRQLDAAEYAMIDAAPILSRVVDVTDGDPDLATAVAVDEPRGVWIVWRTQGVRSDGFTTIFPQDAEINALRQVNADGFGHAEFIEFGTDAAF
jgi:hypothetical protein